MADVGLAMQRAVDKTENMRARASAMDELEAAGAFDDNLTAHARARTTSTASSRSSPRAARSTTTSRR